MTTTLGRNYARALFELARESSSLETVEQDLQAVTKALHADLETRAFLGNRLVSRSAKKSLFGGFRETCDPRVLTLLLLLVDRGRTSLLGEIREEFERLSRLARGVRTVKVFSPFPLGEEEKTRITRALEARLAVRVELQTEIRASLIGGVVAESEGQEIEFSIEGRLKELAAHTRSGGGKSASGGEH
jgi:F-type H+-transporting ATPase subunit delta